MFNSAFLLMYLVGIVGFITPVLAVAAAIITALAIGWYIAFCDENNTNERIRGMATCRNYVLIAAFVWLLAAAVPSKIALYAGAGQYIAEVAELDDTLLGLKDLIDAKVNELTIRSLESTADTIIETD